TAFQRSTSLAKRSSSRGDYVQHAGAWPGTPSPHYPPIRDQRKRCDQHPRPLGDNGRGHPHAWRAQSPFHAPTAEGERGRGGGQEPPGKHPTGHSRVTAIRAGSVAVKVFRLHFGVLRCFRWNAWSRSGVSSVSSAMFIV